MKRTHRFVPLMLAVVAASAACSSGFAASPAEASGWRGDFVTPPLSAHPQVWWHWMNGNVTREGITADLEAMHRIGIQEANIITVASDIPPGPVPVMSPQFFDMVEFAAKDARRLGMTLCIDNCPGWSSSGGPWVKPAQAMQFVTTSETTVEGPTTFSGKLPQPPTKEDYYRDISVLAFKTPTEEPVITADNRPTISTSVPGVDPAPLLKAGNRKVVPLPVAKPDRPYSIEIAFPKAVAAHAIVITAGKMRAVRGVVSVSQDGKTFRPVCPLFIPNDPMAPLPISLGQDALSARCFRLEFQRSKGGSTGVNLKGLRLTNEAKVPDLGAKAGFEPDDVPAQASDQDGSRHFPAQSLVHGSEIVDLTASLQPDGSLRWKAPPGKWTILRVGYTPTGKTNHPAPPEATGLECDKLSRDGLDASWNGMMQPLLDRLGPLAGKVLDHCLIDSYETGGQNWTPAMGAEFKKRRGYDLTHFLPVFTGRVVDSPEKTERFLWDFRRTISDLFAENYYDYFTALCHKHGLRSMIEPYKGPFESLRAGAESDIPMGEFWAGSNGHYSINLAASVGHTYGQKIIAAEALTGSPPAHASWKDDPYSLKGTGDLAFCAGINRFVFHRFAHQPWMNRFPGMTMGKWGINLDRTNTWFDLAGPWITYITRCQYLLQQGKPVSDIAYFCGESVPVTARAGKDPAGYADDSINADVLLHHASVKNHRLVLDDGVSYPLLVLPESDPNMTPDLLRKLRGFVKQGLTILGPRPEHSPSLQDYPRCDEEVKSLAAEMWGKIDGKTLTGHALGEGKVISGVPLAQVLETLHVAPDFSFQGDGKPAHLLFIHRTADQGELYFVANHDAAPVHAQCTFRIAGKIPEFWHPDTGRMERAPIYTVHDGLTTLPIDFDPTGSVFVVFREPDASADHLVAASQKPGTYTLREDLRGSLQVDCSQPGTYAFTTAAGRTLRCDASSVPPPISVAGPWKLAFPPHWGAPASITLDHLISWPDCPDEGVKYFSGTATYTKQFNVPANLLAPNLRLMLNLGRVKNLAQVTLNGKELGILWKPPFAVDITSAVRAGANDLEIRVTNLWPNRLIGDEQLPPDVEWSGEKLARWPQWLLEGKPSPTGRLTFTTWHHITAKTPLLPSGLLGPVEIRTAERCSLKE